MTGMNHLLASDLDGTLIAPHAGGDAEEAAREFARLVGAAEHLGLAYVTGRHLDLACEGIAAAALPEPGLLVCDVGAAVYLRRGGRWVCDEAHRRRLARAWRGVNTGALGRLLCAETGATLQEDARQREFKVSFYAPAGSETGPLVRGMEACLRREEIDAQVVQSIDPESGIVLVDVLPPGAAKDAAVRYLREHAGVDDSRAVFAGDSGNDLAVFLSGFTSIVVGNAAAEVRAIVRRNAPRPERVYLAQGRYARGVIEGCRHFGIFAAA